jgi:hypothetical protein
MSQENVHVILQEVEAVNRQDADVPDLRRDQPRTCSVV